MPSLRLPENYLPSDEELLDVVRRHPGLCLRELCAKLWPALPWSTEGPGGVSACDSPVAWPLPLQRGAIGNRSETATPAQWVRRPLGQLARVRREHGLGLLLVQGPHVDAGKSVDHPRRPPLQRAHHLRLALAQEREFVALHQGRHGVPDVVLRGGGAPPPRDSQMSQ
jgi:hypothetical protein